MIIILVFIQKRAKYRTIYLVCSFCFKKISYSILYIAFMAPPPFIPYAEPFTSCPADNLYTPKHIGIIDILVTSSFCKYPINAWPASCQATVSISFRSLSKLFRTDSAEYPAQFGASAVPEILPQTGDHNWHGCSIFR